MRTGRVEAFSDGVLAILITIMVLELPKPDGGDWSALAKDVPVLLGYALSFVYLGIYWNNHHHTFQVVRRVGGAGLWANLHLLFWLSLVPFVTAWNAERIADERTEHALETVPVVVYGIVLLLAALAYSILQRVLIRAEGADSRLAVALGRDVKGRLSLVLYSGGILAGFVVPWVAVAVYVVVALIRLVPDRRVERFVQQHELASEASSGP